MTAAPDLQPGSDILVRKEDNGTRIVLGGELSLAGVPALRAALDGIESRRGARLDMTAVTRLDTAAAWTICRLRLRLEKAGQNLEIAGLAPAHQRLLETVRDAWPEAEPAPRPRPTLADRLETLGRDVTAGGRLLADLAGYLGLFLTRLAGGLIHSCPGRILLQNPDNLFFCKT